LCTSNFFCFLIPESNSFIGLARLCLLLLTIDGTYIKKIVGQGGKGAFEGKGLETVKLPESLTTIGNRAFLDNNLSSIELPEGILEIGISSFSDNQITEITIPDGVTSVGASAFHENPIKKIVIGDGVSIGDTLTKSIIQRMVAPEHMYETEKTGLNSEITS
jgi:hypothetical protein